MHCKNIVKEERQMKRERKLFKREKRFLLLMPEYVFGGAETQFRYLIDYAEKHEWKLDVWVEHRFHGSNTLLREDAARMRSVRFFEVDKRKNNKDKIFLDFIKYFIKRFPNTRYETCLIYFSKHLELAPMLRLLGICTVYSERNNAFHILDNQCYKEKIKWCNFVLTNSKFAQKKLEELTDKKVYLIKSGKPVVEKLPIKENRKFCHILVPERINASKNQMMILQFLRDYPEFTGKVYFAGKADNIIYRKDLVNFIHKNGLRDKVEFLGYVKDMREEYLKADLVIVPTLIEGTSNVVLESYAYGRPVIVSDIEPERDIVKNPNLRFSLNDTSGIDRCIKYLEGLSDEEYKSLLENNRKFVLENYNLEKMAKKFYRFLSGDIL